jgi:hypothetical protein
MHFNDWPVWARPKDEQANKLTPLGAAGGVDLIGAILQGVADPTFPLLPKGPPARKKPGPKPKAKP